MEEPREGASEVGGSKEPPEEGTRIKEEYVNSMEGKEKAGRRYPDAQTDLDGAVDDWEEARTHSWLELSKLLNRLITTVKPGYSKAGDSNATIDAVIEISAAITELNSSLSEELKKANTERIVTEKEEFLQVLSGFMKQLYSSKMDQFYIYQTIKYLFEIISVRPFNSLTPSWV